ncbi:MAG TPA: hypothetical protein VNH83_19675 [Bryobacteraceae bacterium]|nr:hypothetical protein [Bryobacteraceae bacterium]
MRSWFTLTTAFALLFCTGFLPSARADEWNKQTVVTFNEPVEIPGQVLPAGTYVFKLADSTSDRTIVQIFNKDQDHIYATLLAVPDYRLEPTGKTVIHFEERNANASRAIQAWFYPGDNYGLEFVYPNSRAIELSKNTNKNVLSMPSEMAANTKKPAKSMQEPSVTAMKQAPVTAVKPTGEHVEMAQAVQSHPTKTSAKPTEMANHRPKMPSTASPVPLLALIGLLLTAAGAACALWTRAIRVN